jgi:hypothetical protein
MDFYVFFFHFEIERPVSIDKVYRNKGTHNKSENDFEIYSTLVINLQVAF